MWTMPRCTAQSAASAARRSTLASAAVLAFQAREGQARRAILVLEEPGQLGRRAVGGERLAQGDGGFFDFAMVLRCGERAAALAGARLEEVVHQADPVAARHRPHLVLAVRVERSDAQLAHLRAAEVQRHFPARGRTISSPPVCSQGSTTISVPNMPGVFSVSRCDAKKPPGSYTSSL